MHGSGTSFRYHTPCRAPTGTRLPTITDQGTVSDTLHHTRPCRAPTGTRLPTFTDQGTPYTILVMLVQVGRQLESACQHLQIKEQFLIPYSTILVHVGRRLERACQHSRIKEQFLIPYTILVQVGSRWERACQHSRVKEQFLISAVPYSTK